MKDYCIEKYEVAVIDTRVFSCNTIGTIRSILSLAASALNEAIIGSADGYYIFSFPFDLASARFFNLVIYNNMVKIRLARFGKKKQPTYRIVVSDGHKDVMGEYIEILGHYNPRSKVCEVQKDRVLAWVSKGAVVSPTLHNLLVSQNVLTGKKVRAFSAKKKVVEGEEVAATPVAAPVAAPAATPAPEAPASEPAATA